MTAGCILFASMNVTARFATSGVPWPLVACSRAVVGAMIAFAASRLRKKPLAGLGTSKMWARSIFGTLALTCTFFAIGSKSLPLGDACTLFALTPVLIAILAPRILGEATGPRAWFFVLLSTFGVVLVMRPPFLFAPVFGEDIPLGGHGRASFPALVAILAAVFSSFAMMMLRRIGREEKQPSVEAIVFHFSITGTIFLGLLSLATLHTVPVFDRKSVFAMMAAGTCAGFAQLAMTRAYALETAARIGAFSNLTVVLSAAASMLVLSERLSLHSALGMALVISGSILVSLDGARTKLRDFPPPEDALNKKIDSAVR